MHIIFTYSDKFPEGGAEANRILAISKGFINKGNKVTVLIVRPTEEVSRIKNNEINSVYKSIKIVNTSGSIIWSPRNKFYKIYSLSKGYINSLIKIISLWKSDTDKIVLINNTSPFIFNFGYRTVSSVLRIPYLYHIDEYPWPVIFADNYNKIYTNLYIKYNFKLYDGIIAISDSLMDYYALHKKKSAWLYKLPMIVDSDRFESLEEIKSKTPCITYCGSMSIYKDGVDILIKAFDIAADSIENINLNLIGKTEGNPDFEILNSIKKECRNKDRINFIGEIEREKVPALLKKSWLLALARPENKQAEGGFPTKLGEYLLTGNPVILTNVGDVSKYLSNNYDAFIVQPDSAEIIASSIIEIFSDYNKAIPVGIQGKLTAEKHFGYKNALESFNKFLLSKYKKLA